VLSERLITSSLYIIQDHSPLRWSSIFSSFPWQLLFAALYIMHAEKNKNSRERNFRQLGSHSAHHARLLFYLLTSLCSQAVSTGDNTSPRTGYPGYPDIKQRFLLSVISSWLISSFGPPQKLVAQGSAPVSGPMALCPPPVRSTAKHAEILVPRL